jgi:hypothetical protein
MLKLLDIKDIGTLCAFTKPNIAQFVTVQLKPLNGKHCHRVDNTPQYRNTDSVRQPGEEKYLYSK